MNMDEHLEALEDDFGKDLETTSGPARMIEKKQESSARMNWLTANGPIVKPIQTKKSRWEDSDSMQNDPVKFKELSEKFRRIAAEQKMRAQGSAPPSLEMQKAMAEFMNTSPQMYIPPPATGLPHLQIPVGMFPYLPYPGMIPAQMNAMNETTMRNPLQYNSSRNYSRSPRRRSRSRSPRRRSGSPLSQIRTDNLPEEERRRAEENKLFVKLLYSKLMSIKSNSRLESLHVQLMAMVMKANDEESREFRR